MESSIRPPQRTTKLLERYTTQVGRPFLLDSISRTREILRKHPLELRELRSLIELAELHMRAGHRGRASNCIVLAVLTDEHAALHKIRRRGLLRASKYDLVSKMPIFLLDSLLNHSTELSITDETTSYLESTGALLALAPEAAAMLGQIRNSLRKNRRTILKGILACADYRFADYHPANIRYPTDDPSHHAPELISEAASLLLFEFRRMFPIDEQTVSLMDAESVSNGAYWPIIHDAIKLRLHREWEILIDILDYRCEYDAPLRTATVFHPNPNFEKAIRLGFIQRDMVAVAEQRRMMGHQALSIRDAAKKIVSDLGPRGAQLVDHPVRRLRILFPIPEVLADFLRDDAVLLEEGFHLESAMRMHLIDEEEFRNVPISKTATLGDLMKIHRLFNLLRFVAMEHLKPLLFRDRETFFRSLLPVFRREDLLLYASVPVGSQAKAEEILDLLDWTRKPDRMLDLQYQPLIRSTRDEYLIPINILGTSDLSRNIFAHHRRRIDDFHNPDRFSESLSRTIQAQKHFSASNFPYKFDGQRGEFDCLSIIEGVAFAFECKDSLIPTSAHEIRTSLDYLSTASEQLTRIRSLWENEGFRRYLSSRTKVDLGQCPLITCIVHSNRMFSGYRLQGHAVRGFWELMNFIDDGTLRITNYKIRLRRSGPVTARSLRAYIDGDSVHSKFLSAMIPFDPVHTFGQRTVQERSFVLHAEAIAENFGLRVPDATVGSGQ